MSPSITPDPVRKPTIVTAGTRPDGIEFDPSTRETELDRARNVQRDTTVGGHPGDRTHFGTDAVGNTNQIIDPELVATLMDHRPEDGRDRLLPQLVTRHVERSAFQPTPAGMNPDDPSRDARQKHHGAVGRPHRNVTVNEVGALHVGHD